MLIKHNVYKEFSDRFYIQPSGVEQSGQLVRPITSRSHGSNPAPAIYLKVIRQDFSNGELSRNKRKRSHQNSPEFLVPAPAIYLKVIRQDFSNGTRYNCLYKAQRLSVSKAILNIN